MDTILQILIPFSIFAPYTIIFDAKSFDERLHAQCRWAQLGRPVDQRFNSLQEKIKALAANFVLHKCFKCFKGPSDGVFRSVVYVNVVFIPFWYKHLAPAQWKLCWFCGRTLGLNLRCLVKSSQTFFFGHGRRNHKWWGGWHSHTGWGGSWKTMEWYGWFLKLARCSCWAWTTCEVRSSDTIENDHQGLLVRSSHNWVTIRVRWVKTNGGWMKRRTREDCRLMKTNCLAYQHSNFRHSQNIVSHITPWTLPIVTATGRNFAEGIDRTAHFSGLPKATDSSSRTKGTWTAFATWKTSTQKLIGTCVWGETSREVSTVRLLNLCTNRHVETFPYFLRSWSWIWRSYRVLLPYLGVLGFKSHNFGSVHFCPLWGFMSKIWSPWRSGFLWPGLVAELDHGTSLVAIEKALIKLARTFFMPKFPGRSQCW